MQLRLKEVVRLYRNLRAEMARKSVKINDIANFLDVRYATICDKMNGKFRFYYDEAAAIKEHFFPEHDLEYLFNQKKEV